MKLPKQWKLLVLVVLVAGLFAIAWQTRERFETPPGYIREDGKYIDSYVPGASTTPEPLASAVQTCNTTPGCIGVTQEPGQSGFTMRSKASMGSRPGAMSYRKPANAWAAAGFSITPPPVAAAGGGALPYDNSKVYKVGDSVVFGGEMYKMVESAGAPGYAPNRPGDRLWQKQAMTPPVGAPLASTGGPSALQAPISSVTPLGGTPAPVPPSSSPSVEPTIVLPNQTSAGTYFLRKAA